MSAPEAAGSPPSASSVEILLVGEALIDIVHRTDGRVDESPGGSPANVALTLGRLGDAPELVTALGADAHGRQIRTWLAASDVRVRGHKVDRTATATARLAADGSATYDFDILWNLPEGLLPEHPGIVHTGSIAAFLRPGADAVRRILEAAHGRALVTYDPNVRPALLPDVDEARRTVEALVALADVVKASDEDLLWLYPGREPLEIAAAWRATGPAVVIVTLGGQGSAAVTATGVSRVPGKRVQVVDTVGAGDTFMGALIHGLAAEGCVGSGGRERVEMLSKDVMERILDFAATAAAITVSRPGADPPRLAELTSI